MLECAGWDTMAVLNHALEKGSAATPTAEQSRFNAAVMNWISEATSVWAEACRSDGGRKIMRDACMSCWDAYCPTNHDAAPAARASVESVAPQPTTRGDSDRTDKAAPRPSEGTGDTPATHATRGEGSERRECTEPVAWAVMPANSDYCVTLSARREAAQKAAERKVEVGEYATMDDIVVVPLYRQPQPTLTDAEREAVEFAVATADDYHDDNVAATLRGLLERTK